MNSGSVTVQEYLNTFRAAFLLLSSSRRAALVRKARAFIENHPGCADHAIFGGRIRGLNVAFPHAR
jgi:hypothetical protein